MSRIKLFTISLIVFVVIWLLLYFANPLIADATLTEPDYLEIAYDLYFHPDDCEGQKIVARGLWYFIGGGEQIANYTDIESYYAGGLEWLELACPIE